MIQELVEYGKQLTNGKSMALKEESCATVIAINENGIFQGVFPYSGDYLESEVITAKKGKARFLLDRCEETLGVEMTVAKLDIFIKAISAAPYKDLRYVKPIIRFYKNKNKGLKKAISEFFNIDEQLRSSNITFSVGSVKVLENSDIQYAIKQHVEKKRAEAQAKGKSVSIHSEKKKCSIELVINENGEFQEFRNTEEVTVTTEVIKTNNISLFLGDCTELLGLSEDIDKKHYYYMEKLKSYNDVNSLYPIFRFYENKAEMSAAIADAVSFYLSNKHLVTGNITYMVGTNILLNTKDVKNAITVHFHEKEKKLLDGWMCSICGTSNSPVLDEPHGLIKLFRKQKVSSALVSYNISVFESYGLKRNQNSSICRDCARNYIEGLKSLLSGNLVGEDDKKHYKYDHRVNISDNTVAIFWTQQETEYNPLMVTNPPQSSEIVQLFESIWSGESKVGEIINSNMFYSCTLASAAARISVRDWTAISLDEYKKNIADWFKDIEIINIEGNIEFCSLYGLVNSTFKTKKKGDPDAKSRIGSLLWNAAIKGRLYKTPLHVMQSVLNRLWVGDFFSTEKAAVIKLVINRNTDINMKSTLDETNTSVAYLCGRLFAVIETMQWKAIGNVNSSIKDRLFAAAAVQPAHVFGMLLTKYVPVYQHKIGGYLKPELEKIVGVISECGSFPKRFSAFEQGEFALGYYFQRTHKSNNK